MKEIRGDIWDYHKKGHWIVITTNGNVKKNGQAVMGRGVALQAAQRFPELPWDLGSFIDRHGAVLCIYPDYKLFALPTKYDWRQRSDIQLIEKGIKALADTVSSDKLIKEVYLVRPGCNNGGLDWKDVRPILEKYLDDRFVVVQR